MNRVNSKFIPDRKVLAGGVGAIVTWLALMALEHFAGIVISSDVAGLIVAAVAPTVSWIVPPSIKDVAVRLDGDLRRVFEQRQAMSPGLSPPSDQRD
jgi:hypothetical protein